MINILISTYNGAAYIEEQLDSIFMQVYQEFQVFIRDDGSTDNTIEVIEQYIQINGLSDRIILVCGENIGFCKSFFELLLMTSEGDYWAFCDQDDRWYPDKLRLAVEWMEGQKNKDIPLLYHSGFELGNADMTKRTPYHPQYFHYEFYNSITSNIFFGFSTTINRGLYERLILADPGVIKYHDWFAAMITAAFGKYHLSGQVEAVHRQHKNNSSPLFFVKKIPHGIKLLKGDTFYTNNAREFMRLFGDELDASDKQILAWFVQTQYSFNTALKKTFYPKRWNPQLSVELILRGLMLVGKL